LNHVALYSDAIGALDTDDEFHAWFNKADSAYHAQVNGFWDFAIHIATPAVRFHLKNPHEQVALEIGCGGGRLLGAASHFFRKVIGLDIHSSMDRVAHAMERRAITNYELVRGEGELIPLPDHSIDFVYSFITLHHLQSFGAFCSYVRESRRVLKSGGLALLYYGKGRRLEARQEYAANSVSLVMSRDDAVSAAVSAGFELLEEGDSWRFGEERLRHGYQGSMLLRR
jgi:ubiquinone/menaquinone biosynthesis C-methylase UbiE